MEVDVIIYDTTLRDGTQGENISFSAKEKLDIALRLDDFGVHYIEGGWPGSNPRDREFFELACKTDFKNSKLAAFGSTRRPGIPVHEDQNIIALLESETPVVTIFGKTWLLHVGIMNNTPEENLAMIEESVAYIAGHGREVIYDAEHFFDGYKDDPGYALKTLEAAVSAGASYIVLCDTNGGSLPHEIEAIIDEVKKSREGTAQNLCIGIHTHNDSGLAVANSVVAVHKGAVMVQGTINGYGERSGNADLTSVIPILALKMNKNCVDLEKLKQLKRLSRFVSETANLVPQSSRPFVGESAFAHKGGIHVSAITKEQRAYEHMLPEDVGNARRVLISELSGKSNIEYKAKELGVELGLNGYDSTEIATKIKSLEQAGYQFDVADGSFKILLEKLTDQHKPCFSLESFRVTIEKDKDSHCKSHATIKVSGEDFEEITAAEGNGPVSALDNALRKALAGVFPDIDDMRLVDFKVRVVDGNAGTAAMVRVLIESRDQDTVWRTVGVSEDIIEASWQALADSVMYKLSKKENGNSN